jgi:cytochrome P450
MTLRDILNDPEVYQDCRTFNPYRWFEEDKEKVHRLNYNFVPFGRGSRMCLGVK